ncbi:two-component system, NarL family, sensor histidine kinase DegS [Desulfotomaculum arcticum]|uniref:histidine kinase n=1 Tax=Desulfotruncus arcticus DSM 17038 TaxID=1121424 RepID=A0A1I2Z1T2_9FIRM|nr:sensor histidine kinase [Desulfotruncus arcticus]SFH31813.1 two-component system, NarL family, sensor histidine kinase DegS [Desulfotomaculum arcticum] [Desulfotruncus arcticus DSM 17038]
MLNAALLDKIINEILLYIQESQEQVYDIAENTRTEHARVKDELEDVRKTIIQLIDRVDKLYAREKRARLHLMEVSKDFNRYTEADIKRAYERAQKLQLEVAGLQGQEHLLRYKRDNLERNLRSILDMQKKAENIMSHLGVVSQYLSKHMESLSTRIGELMQIQQLGINIIRAQEEERKRVAREIHDGPAQLLANIVMRAEYILKLMEVEPQNVKTELMRLQELVRQSLQDVRKIIFDLRPMVLDDLGLVPALNRYVEDYRNQHKQNIEFVFFGKQARLNPATEVALFRVVQEALNNVRKHAKAKNVLVKMEQLDDKVAILIKDDGIGFTPDNLEHHSGRECYGLINMRERVQILKGEYKIISGPGKGTLITLTIPVFDLRIK